MSRPTRAECIQAVGELLAEQDALNAARSPRELAEAAWTPGCGRTVEEIEDSIRVNDRGLPPLHSKTPKAS